MKKPVAVVCTVIGTGVLLAAADYFAMFGASSKVELDLIEMHFVTVDEETGTPVTGVHVRCFQSNNNNACTERSGDTPGSVNISIPVTKTVTRSYLFVQSSMLRETVDPHLKVMFIHPDYANPVETFRVADLPAQSDRSFTVSMPRSLAGKY